MHQRAASRLLRLGSTELCRVYSGATASIATTACSDQQPSAAWPWRQAPTSTSCTSSGDVAVRPVGLSQPQLHSISWGMPGRSRGMHSAVHTSPSASLPSLASSALPAPSHGSAALPLCSTSSASDALFTSGADVGLNFLAASPLEAFAAMPPPTQLSIQAWELVHLGVGLPWWASIPLTTLLLRTLLLPFTLKAKAASVNFSLWGHAFGQASQALVQEGQSAPLPMRERLRATSLVFRYLKSRHQTPSTWWYLGNSLVQVPTFILLSFGLRRMCDIQWPGLSGEGLLLLSDLTAPSVVAATWATPYGPYGLFLPLAIFATYASSLQFSAAARSPAVATALETISLPYLCAAMISPQAVQLYWLSNSAFHLGLQALLSKPQIARVLKLPMMLVQPRTEADAKAKKDADAEDLQQLVDASIDPELLQLLAHDQMAAGHHKTAAATFLKALKLNPGHLPIVSGAALAHAKVQDFKKAAELYQQAAEGSTTAADKAHFYSLSAINFLEASVEVPASAAERPTPASITQAADISTSAHTSNSPSVISQARAAATKAITLQPYSPSCHLSKAYVELMDGAAEAAYASISRCLELSIHFPDDAQQKPASAIASSSSASDTPASSGTTAQPACDQSIPSSIDTAAATASEGKTGSIGQRAVQQAVLTAKDLSAEQLRVMRDAVALGERVAKRVGEIDQHKQQQLEELLTSARMLLV